MKLKAVCLLKGILESLYSRSTISFFPSERLNLTTGERMLTLLLGRAEKRGASGEENFREKDEMKMREE